MLGIDGTLLATQIKYAAQFIHMGVHVLKEDKKPRSDLPWYYH